MYQVTVRCEGKQPQYLPHGFPKRSDAWRFGFDVLQIMVSNGHEPERLSFVTQSRTGKPKYHRFGRPNCGDDKP